MFKITLLLIVLLVAGCDDQHNPASIHARYHGEAMLECLKQDKIFRSKRGTAWCEDKVDSIDGS